VAVYIDSGILIGVPTSIIDFSGTKAKVIRDGVLSAEEVLDVYG
jgi:tRNA A37 threonylcarbamoyladenosine synthetase subunit TsaC/SUA5/YrdC